MSLGIVSRSFRRGAPHLNTTIDGAQVVQGKGKIYYVDGNNTGGGDGLTFSTAFDTMAEAFSVLVGGETIYLAGRIIEQLTAPAQIFDVSIVGIGNRPRHADAAPSGGNLYTAQWGAAGLTAATANLTLLQQGWRVENILFSMIDANACGVNLLRNAGSGNAERDASHATIRGCKFAGAGIGVKFGAASFAEIVNNTLIEENYFLQNTTAIADNTGSGVSIYTHIIKNFFQRNTNDIVLPASHSRIIGNVMSLAPTASIVLTGGTGSNQVHGNYLPGTYGTGTLYTPGTNDNWNGNYASTGVTAAVPA